MKELWKEGGIHQKTRCWAQVRETYIVYNNDSNH